jgi:hypothetical protein
MGVTAWRDAASAAALVKQSFPARPRSSRERYARSMSCAISHAAPYASVKPAPP